MFVCLPRPVSESVGIFDTLRPQMAGSNGRVIDLEHGLISVSRPGHYLAVSARAPRPSGGAIVKGQIRHIFSGPRVSVPATMTPSSMASGANADSIACSMIAMVSGGKARNTLKMRISLLCQSCWNKQLEDSSSEHISCCVDREKLNKSLL